jgi:dTDP-4-dehydrorhamnose reductase
LRILILGKDGMLGHDLEATFRNDDYIAFGRGDLDVTNKEMVFEKFMTVQPDVVINATGYTNVDLAESEEEKANLINGYAVGVLARACREVGATLVHFSSDYVFPGLKKHGYGEEDTLQPLNAYGRSKALGEKLLIEEMELMDGEMQQEGHYFLIRTSWLYGAHGKNFVDTMLDLGRQKKELKVVQDQHGRPTFSLDLCQQVKWLINTHDYPSGIYHVTNDSTTTWHDFAVEIFRLAGMRLNVVACTSSEFPRPAQRPEYSALINNKLPPLRPWKEALRDYLNHKSV